MSSQTTETTLTVTGMTCDHCARAVRDELSRLAGVSAVDVDLVSGRVRIVSLAPVTGPEVRAAVEEAGYEVAS